MNIRECSSPVSHQRGEGGHFSNTGVLGSSSPAPPSLAVRLLVSTAIVALKLCISKATTKLEKGEEMRPSENFKVGSCQDSTIVLE